MVYYLSASTGGLLGLFLGFSVLSIVEVVYFVSIRPYYKKGKDKSAEKEKKKIPTNVMKKPIFSQNQKIGPRLAWMKYDTAGVDENFIPFPYTE